MIARILLFTFVLLAALFFPSAAFAQETTIITPVVPPPSTDWVTLVAIGSGYTFAIVALIRQLQPKIDGRLVYVLVIPIACGVALYQVGFADVKLLGKHTGMLLLTTYGGTAGLRKLGSWALAAYAAYRAGVTIPPAPDLESVPVSIPKPSRLPPPLPLLLCLALLLVGCGAPAQLLKTVEAGRDVANAAEPCLVAEKTALLVRCEGKADCERDVADVYKPIEAALDLFHEGWCALSPTSDGCAK